MSSSLFELLMLMLIPIVCIILIAIIVHAYKQRKRRILSDPHHDSVYRNYNKKR